MIVSAETTSDASSELREDVKIHNPSAVILITFSEGCWN